MSEDARNAVEVNYDGLVGPTHNYAGLSIGNEASTQNEGKVSDPKAAALQGLTKMKHLLDLGLVQGVIPPHERPAIGTLRRMGFHGGEERILEAAWKFSPELLARTCSASSMWVANAATVSPSADTEDGRVHFTPANLATLFHREIESAQTSVTLRRLFADEAFFAHHPALPSSSLLGDEGAANHMRLSKTHGDQGVEIFVWGRQGLAKKAPTSKYPARQTLEASRLVARAHGLSRNRCLFVQQNPEVIDEGVFHNDVIAVANESVLFAHEKAFVGGFSAFEGLDLEIIEVPDDRVSVADAVTSYLFNSQLVTTDHGMRLIAPSECRENERVHAFLEALVDRQNAIEEVHYLDLRESMRNGGGPACLRLRVVLTPAELEAAHAPCLLDATRIAELETWVVAHYRDRLEPDDLRDPALLRESREALDELTEILELGPIYPFQQVAP